MGGRKRKHSEAEAAAPVKKDEAAPERPKRTLMGFKDKVEQEKETTDSKPTFRNKEKVLVTCSRRISYRSKIDSFAISLVFLHVENEYL